MGRTIKIARFPTGGAPETTSQRYATGQTFTIGAALALTAGELTEAVSPITGATLWGFAQEAVASKPGWGIANAPTVVTGQVQEVSAVRANALHVYSAQLVNGSAVPVVPAQADLGAVYGLKSYAVNGKNEWYVDKSQTAGNACVTVVDFDLDTNIVLFTVMAARMLAQ
jgi:hypothetical protein